MKNPTKEQIREWNRKYYLKNKEKRIAQYTKAKKDLTAWFREYKKTLKCKVCGFSHPAALAFHHRDGETKVAEVSVIAFQGSRRKLEREIAKCDVMCHNCHAIHHYEERHAELAQLV
jgi:hypothetical protein